MYEEFGRIGPDSQNFLSQIYKKIYKLFITLGPNILRFSGLIVFFEAHIIRD